MKFWKCLNTLIEKTLPDWRDKFLSYKDLKQQLKLIYPKDGERENKRRKLDSESGEVPKEVNDFVKLLEGEIDKFNAFVFEKEEGYVISLKELQDRLAKLKDSTEELMKVGKEIADLHGEMVLLENYSALNYTGLVKILKKYEKRTGALLRLPFIQRVLQQPFFSMDLINKLVKECERMLEYLISINKPTVLSQANDRNEACNSNGNVVDNEPLLKVPKELEDIENMENMYMKATLSALRILKQIRSESSTVSMFSLPPLQRTGSEEVWKKVPVAEEQAAK
ncbi:SPX domain [Dillenia turbinata]|uniref:SPX domain n=1 Tax=Dillenia turbinata TaxID=194707 RepID=A0AAN8U903_9MAGN